MMASFYHEMCPPDDPSYRPTAVARTMFVDRIGRRQAGVILDTLAASDAPIRVTQVRVLGGAYVNFLSNEGAERVRAAYPGSTWDRLRAIKKRYDPDNFFRSNENIAP